MVASKAPTSVGGCCPSTRQLHKIVTPRAWWNSKLTPLGPVTVTPSSSTLETGASATAHMMPGLFAPEAVEAVMFRSVMLLQKGVVLVMGWVSSVVGGKEEGFG